MIRVEKPTQPPAHLIARGPTAADALKTAYDATPADYRAGIKKLTIRRDLYAHATVAAKLRSAQHNKCCFCERKAEGDVEHFRPKGGYQQSTADTVQYPGYYWLAYDWSNLFFSCGPCNQRHKKNFFPLEDPAARACCHHDDVATERPLLIHPSNDDPEQHIQFHQELAEATTGNVRGQTTIDVLHLNREDLRESRADRLRPIVLLRDTFVAMRSAASRLASQGKPIPSALQQQLPKLEAELRSATEPTTEYTAMARCALANVF